MNEESGHMIRKASGNGGSAWAKFFNDCAQSFITDSLVPGFHGLVNNYILFSIE